MVARSEQPDEEEREGGNQNEHGVSDKARAFEEQARHGHTRDCQAGEAWACYVRKNVSHERSGARLRRLERS